MYSDLNQRWRGKGLFMYKSRGELKGKGLGDGGFVTVFGWVCYRIRILMYLASKQAS